MAHRQQTEILLVLLLIAATARAATAGDLIIPLSCDVGRTCFIQNYVDIDDGPSAKDYMCGTLTYDGHNGIDFRLSSHSGRQKPMHVVAAAEGTVLRTRDGLADSPVKTDRRDAAKGNECGNGVVVRHSGDRETQYCHMAKDSILVKPGDAVRAGQVLGTVGMSGLTEYPHLHFIVRREGKVIDPFGAGSIPDTCGNPTESEWRDDVRARLTYSPRAVLNFGFATEAVTNDMIEVDDVSERKPTTKSEALVVYVRTIGLKAGDDQSLTLRDPEGRIIAEKGPIAVVRNQAQTILFTGKKRSTGPWPSGVYSASYIVAHNGTPVLTQVFRLDLPL
jgi:murein DD-endopeptidase MepM/ murein hydrolase activator NlpD